MRRAGERLLPVGIGHPWTTEGRGEAWLGVGGALEDLPDSRDEQAAERVAMVVAGDTGARLAGAVALWAGAALDWEADAGACSDRDAEAREKGMQEAGKHELPAVSQPPRKAMVPQRGLVVISVPEKLANLGPDVQVLGELQEWIHSKLAGWLAHSARANYGEAWSKSLWWCARRGIPPLLSGERKRQVNEGEEVLLRFTGYLGWPGKGNSALLSALFAFQGGRVLAGGGGPLACQEAHRGPHRLTAEGPKEERKLGAAPRVMARLKGELAPAPPKGPRGTTRGDEASDAVVFWATLTTGFFYLFPAKEIADGGGVDEQMCLRGVGVALHDEGGGSAPRGLGKAARALVTFRKATTVQRAFGACRVHHRANVEVCPVAALELRRGLAPERFAESAEGRRHLFRWSSGEVVKREQLQAALQRAAAAEAPPPRRSESRGLRVGGAPARRRALGDAVAVMRWGRWSSAAFHGYHCDSEEQSWGVAATVARGVATPRAA
ncbi:unnamed protein product [Prorocentrum cordatum]|uniref:Uncharacterized protein n=1 Tax=Prorocentrum cordatum TaxID=2364126 RepID=A0ABN9WSF6_9DINO|nr:unnamed protein product [Polarella glacialis]